VLKEMGGLILLYDEVATAIVTLALIVMVYDFTFAQPSPQFFLGNQPMFVRIPAHICEMVPCSDAD